MMRGDLEGRARPSHYSSRICSRGRLPRGGEWPRNCRVQVAGTRRGRAAHPVHSDAALVSSASNSADPKNMRNMIRTALIVGTLATPMISMADTPKKDEAAKTEEKKTDAKDAPKADAKKEPAKKDAAKKDAAKKDEKAKDVKEPAAK